MISTILGGVAAFFKGIAAALGLIQQNKDQQAGAAMQRDADSAAVVSVQQKQLQTAADDSGADPTASLKDGTF